MAALVGALACAGSGIDCMILFQAGDMEDDEERGQDGEEEDENEEEEGKWKVTIISNSSVLTSRFPQKMKANFLLRREDSKEKKMEKAMRVRKKKKIWKKRKKKAKKKEKRGFLRSEGRGTKKDTLGGCTAEKSWERRKLLKNQPPPRKRLKR